MQEVFNEIKARVLSELQEELDQAKKLVERRYAQINDLSQETLADHEWCLDQEYPRGALEWSLDPRRA